MKIIKTLRNKKIRLFEIEYKISDKYRIPSKELSCIASKNIILTDHDKLCVFRVPSSNLLMSPNFWFNLLIIFSVVIASLLIYLI